MRARRLSILSTLALQLFTTKATLSESGPLSTSPDPKPPLPTRDCQDGAAGGRCRAPEAEVGPPRRRTGRRHPRRRRARCRHHRPTSTCRPPSALSRMTQGRDRPGKARRARRGPPPLRPPGRPRPAPPRVPRAVHPLPRCIPSIHPSIHPSILSQQSRKPDSKAKLEGTAPPTRAHTHGPPPPLPRATPNRTTPRRSTTRTSTSSPPMRRCPWGARWAAGAASPARSALGRTRPGPARAGKARDA
jgi:hypothetical protein